MSSNTKKLIILVLVIMLISWVMSAVCGISALGFTFLKKNTSRGDGKTFPLSRSYSEIKIDSEKSDIRFYLADSGSGKIVWSGNSAMKLSVNTMGGRLIVKESYRLPWFLRIGVVSGTSEIGIYLPSVDFKELEAENDHGNITVPAGFSFTDAEIQTDTGAVDFQADVSRTLKIRTDTGRINCGGAKPEKLDIHSDTGTVSVMDVRAGDQIGVKTDTGKIILNDVRSGKISAESDTGSISLANVFASDTIDLETDTGSIELDRCDAGKLEIESDTGSVNGTLLTEKIFNVRSSTGRIDVPESGSGGECKIKTDTGSITIRITK